MPRRNKSAAAQMAPRRELDNQDWNQSMHFTCRHDQQSVVGLAIVARELYSNRTVANFLP
jgi:hypothetical protein